jgi:peptide/nickel transport system substrate-binding protein
VRRTAGVSKEHLEENLVEPTENLKLVRIPVFEWLLLIVAVILLAIVQMIWYTNTYSSQAFVAGGTYSEGTIGKISSMNPLYATTESEKAVARLAFASLSDTDAEGFPALGLAQSITSKDAKVWQVKLREHLVWSDGQPITAEDVRWTFQTIQDDASKTIYGDLYDTVQLRVDSEFELTFTLRSPYSYFISSLNFPILPAHILGDVSPAGLYEHSFGSRPVGSGPFVVQSIQAVAGGNEQKLLLDRNPHYYAQTLLDHFAIHTYPDRDSLRRALDFLQVTATAGLDPQNTPTNPNLNARQAAVSGGTFLFLNCDSNSSALGNLKLRQALRSSLDIETLRNDLGQPYPLTTPIIRTQLDVPQPEVPGFDLEQAKQLLQGVDLGQVPELTIAAPDAEPYLTIANRTQEALTALGLKSTINAVPSQDLVLSVIRPRAYDILVYDVNFGIDNDPFSFYHSSAATGEGLNFSNYRSSIVDDALLAARTSLDPTLRAAKYDRFLRTWVNDVPSIPLYQSAISYYYNRTTRPFSENVQLTTALDRFNDVSLWATQREMRLRTP